MILVSLKNNPIVAAEKMCIHEALSKIISAEDLDIFIKFITAFQNQKFDDCDCPFSMKSVENIEVFALFQIIKKGVNGKHCGKNGIFAETILLYLLKRNLVNEINHSRETPLHIAAENGLEKTVKLLLDHGADYNIENKDAFTPMIQAIRYRKIEIVELLLKHGFDPNKENSQHITPLYYAVCVNNMEIIELLLKYGANPNKVKNYNNYQIIHHAISGCSCGVVELLIKYGADMNVDSMNLGNTFIHIAIEKNDIELLKLLLKYKHDPNKKNNKDQTPLHCLIDMYNINMEMLKLLLNYGVNVNEKDNDETTVLHKAIYHDNSEIVKLLLDYGADHTLCDKNGITPLHNAVRRGNKKVVGLLMDYGADINKLDKYENTPLDYAIITGGKKMANLLWKKSNIGGITIRTVDPKTLKFIKRKNILSKKINTELILQSYEFDSTSLFSCDYLCRDLLFLILKKAKNENTLSMSYELVNY